MADNGNGHKEDLTVEGLKALYPEMAQGPLISGSIDSGNPGIRLVSNDDKLVDMLKIVYIETIEDSNNFSDALAECDEFLVDERTGKPDPEVLQRIEWIKYRLASRCSVGGRFADAYKQAAVGVLTNTATERGWKPLNLPMGRYDNNQKDHNSGNGNNQKRP